MDIVNSNEGHYEQREKLLQAENENAIMAYTTDSESCGSNDHISDDLDKITDDEQDLKSDLQKTIPECYKSDLSYSSASCCEFSNDEDLQASALCQFMDILNDLDEVLDKSLLACLDNEAKFQSDDDNDDVICKIGFNNNHIDTITYEEPTTSVTKEVAVLNCPVPSFRTRGRSKSFSETFTNQEVVLMEPRNENNSIRSSMRRLDPIVLPTIQAEQASYESVTLPVILFLEHQVNMRPTSAPMQLQVTAANMNGDISSAPIIVGRHALLMNRALSLPSPGEGGETIGDWTRQNTVRSTAHSTSTSTSSSESLNGILSPTPRTPTTIEQRIEETEDPPFGVWPHRLSCMLACLSCTVGIFNISRFAIFSIHFGANFIVQFFILSLLIGIPLFTLHLCLGQVLKSGPVDMWKISPIFQGVGVSLLLIQAVIGMYSIIGLSWILVYFRDAFISQNDRYKWSMPHDYIVEDGNSPNITFRIQDTIPEYFHAEVLQRNIATSIPYFGTIKFQAAFNLAVIWMIVFVALSKGLRSYGKAVYAVMFLPICGTLILCIKLLTLIPYNSVINIFSETEWSEFFINSNSWAAAAQETFLTWGLLGVCVMQLTSHKNSKNKTPMILQKESACIVSFTLAILLLAAFLANTCMQILKSKGFVYLPGSFENVTLSQFLWSTSESLPGSARFTSIKYMGHYGSLVGITVWWNGNNAHKISGWQPLQLATQIVPATLATLPSDELSPVWAVIFYYILIMFGIAQQLAIWHCVITGILAINAQTLRVWETTITFLSCVVGLMMGLLLTTDAGVKIVHFIDFVWVGSWWQCLVHVALACGVFVVRGRPYSGDVVVAALYSSHGKLSATLATLLSFTWNVILPVVLCAVCVVDFRSGLQRQLYSWRRPAGYWPIWCRQLAVVMQQGTLLTVPVAAFIQTWRYMSKGPPDILERVQNLYRPRMGAPSEGAPRIVVTGTTEPRPDPPPKYTPPPSYSTATGARLFSTLRRSFRTLRRITTTRTPSTATADTLQLPVTLSEAVDNETPMSLESQPPEYSGVFSTPSITVTNDNERQVSSVDGLSRPLSSISRNSLSLTRDFLRRSFVKNSGSAKNIRSSLRRSFRYGAALTTSHEYLVRDVEPISTSVAMSAMLETPGSPHAHSRASVI